MAMINQAETQTENLTDEKEILTVENNYWVGLKLALDRLRENADFKAVVLEGYFKDRAVNGVSMMCAPTSDGNVKKDLLDEMMAISKVIWYFKMIDHMGSTSEEE